jgi:hypothetical protein
MKKSIKLMKKLIKIMKACRRSSLRDSRPSSNPAGVEGYLGKI